MRFWINCRIWFGTLFKKHQIAALGVVGSTIFIFEGLVKGGNCIKLNFDLRFCVFFHGFIKLNICSIICDLFFVQRKKSGFYEVFDILI